MHDEDNLLDKLLLDMEDIKDRVFDQSDIEGYHLIVITKDKNRIINKSNTRNWLHLLGVIELFTADLKLDMIGNLQPVDKTKNNKFD